MSTLFNLVLCSPVKTVATLKFVVTICLWLETSVLIMKLQHSKVASIALVDVNMAAVGRGSYSVVASP